MVITDVENDKGTDFSVKGKRDQHELVLTQEQKVQATHTLEPEQSRPVAGC